MGEGNPVETNASREGKIRMERLIGDTTLRRYKKLMLRRRTKGGKRMDTHTALTLVESDFDGGVKIWKGTKKIKQ